MFIVLILKYLRQTNLRFADSNKKNKKGGKGVKLIEVKQTFVLLQ